MTPKLRAYEVTLSLRKNHSNIFYAFSKTAVIRSMKALYRDYKVLSIKVVPVRKHNKRRRSAAR